VSVLAQLEAWLIEPLPERPAPTALVSVVGLTQGCGATTVARALAARRVVRVTDGFVDPDATAAIVVAPPDGEPALAELFARSLPIDAEPLIVVNRSRCDDRWRGRAAAFVPESQLGARLAALGREPFGPMGRAIASLADRVRSQSGQALVLMLGAMATLVMGALLLGALGKAYGAKSHAQRAADLAAVSAAREMRDAYPRLFERDQRHLSLSAYLALAREAAVRGASANDAHLEQSDVTFPDAASFAPVRVTVTLRDRTTLLRDRHLKVAARATAALVPDASGIDIAGGGYSGPFAYRQGKLMRPDVALAFDRLAAAAKKEAGIDLLINSAYRSDAEQARLFAANPDPKWVARPGESLHRYGTELDLGPPSAYGWLQRNAGRFHFIQRYAWEEWHWGFGLNPASRPSAGDGSRAPDLQSFVPPNLEPTIAAAAQRWNVSGVLLAAQLYAESNFNPFATSGAGAEGIAQFMPGTAHAYGLTNPFDPSSAIDAQAHLMRDLLRQFASVPLALAAYNAGSGRVAACGCIPPIPETQAYVAKILGLMGGAGEAVGVLEVKLVA
jgi:soluble lytic murein transglycosylase-like protein